MSDLSIIVVSYNTKQITHECIESVIASLRKSSIETEIVLVDNNSHDGTLELFDSLINSYNSHKIKFFMLPQTENLGFSKANNIGLQQSQGRYVLFLNSDVIVNNVNFDELIQYLDENLHVGAMTVAVRLPNGKIDLASHRGFPTIWRSFCYFLGLESLFGKMPLLNNFFGGYHLLGRNFAVLHDIDSPSGAFFLARSTILKKLHGFDEKFFMYGEDIDLAFRIKQLGTTIIYNPTHSVLHSKYTSGLHNKDTRLQKKVRGYFYEAMKIFYQKHYFKKYPMFLNRAIFFCIDLKHKLIW